MNRYLLLNNELKDLYKNEKIFISIASYRDSEVINTILNAYNNAKNKNNIVFGVYLQDSEEDKIDLSELPNEINIKYEKVNWYKARGPIFARYKIYKLFYNNELYYLQIDSHTRFIKNWDEELINMLTTLPVKSIISTYPNGYKIGNNNLNVKSKMNIIKFKKIKDGIPIFTSIKENLKEPKKNLFWAAGFSFSYGFIFKLIKIDPYLKNLFWGEEFLMSLRFYTNGIHIFTPHKNIVFTLWDREYRHTFWEIKNRNLLKFNLLNFLSKGRLFAISNLNRTSLFEDKIYIEIDNYSVGNYKSIKDFYNESKIIDYIKNINYKELYINNYNSLNLK